MVYSSDWMLLARDPAALAHEELRAAETDAPSAKLPRPLWTDALQQPAAGVQGLRRP